MRKTISLLSLISGLALFGLLFVPGASLPDEHLSSCASAPEPAAPPEAPLKDPLTGIWSRYEAGGLGAPFRFYYFHGDGHGLYRYGKVGYTNTNSFDYTIRGDTLSLVFRKTGVRHEVKFKIESDPKDGDREWLALEGDPREPGARYFRERSDPVSTLSSCSRRGVNGIAPADIVLGVSPLVRRPVYDDCQLAIMIERRAPSDGGVGPAAKDSPAGRMWNEQIEYATGGMGFAIYQFKDAGIDGRGTGWYHEGDYDDWTTESLSYRLYGDRVELYFELRGETFTARYNLDAVGGKRRLTLSEDPRNFWLGRSFLDMGRSF